MHVVHYYSILRIMNGQEMLEIHLTLVISTPPLVQSHSYVGNVTESLANELGLSSDVAVYAGVAIMHVVQLVLVSFMIKVHYVA